MNLYSLFFPVFADDGEDAPWQLEKLRSLTEFEAPEVPTRELGSEDFASLLAYLVGAHTFDSQSDDWGFNLLPGRLLFEAAASYLGVPVQDVEGVVHAFSYDPFGYPVFGALRDGGYVSPCEVLPVQNICRAYLERKLYGQYEY